MNSSLQQGRLQGADALPVYHYFAHGLQISSDLFCPEMALATDPEQPVDVRIRLGLVPQHLEQPLGVEAHFEVNQTQFLFWVDGVARYLVNGGDEIIIQPAAGSHMTDVRLYLLGSAIGILLHQRGRLVLHGCTIATAQGAIIFVGESGIGKSALAAAFLARGYQVLTEDVASIAIVPGQVDQAAGFQVYPGLAQIKLWAETVAMLGHDAQMLPRVMSTHDKFSLPLDHAYRSTPLYLGGIYLLEKTTSPATTVELLAQRQKFAVVLQNTYRVQYLLSLKMHGEHFRIASAIAAQIPVGRIQRPAEGSTPQQLAAQIESLLALSH